MSRLNNKSVDQLSFYTMHLSSLLSATLIALSAGAPSIDTATEENIPAVDVLVKRRTQFIRLQCGAVHIFDQAACESLTRYRVACLLVVATKYENCKRQASNDVPNDDVCTGCGEKLRLCLRICVSFEFAYSIQPLIIYLLTHAIRMPIHPKKLHRFAYSAA